MIKRLLIANRGEIAVRIIRAAEKMGIETVAVYSEADAKAQHARLAGQAICIGPAPAAASYLSADAIIEAAKQAGADAIHPGYGFLSENAAFAKAVTDAGLIFVGPSANVIAQMGDKRTARGIAEKAGVPVVPGFDSKFASDDTLTTEAEKIGTPLMIKATAGGGGRGMRRVNDIRDFREALQSAAREAGAAFGDSGVFLERVIENARHVEVQILADTHGTVLHLLERDCSAQRRHQ
ncbi:MAG: ATP-grasp domain-containing protein, partial [Alphaproteobacteria bacterium]|nr:ATP-grasp domain-containing protein [Alphaproteobacteria bacterium]